MAPPNSLTSTQCPYLLERTAKRPFFNEVVVCSCQAAAPVSKPIPKTSLAVSRCLEDAHRYCDVFLDNRGSRAAVTVPEHLSFAPNHMWLDAGPNETCHVGIDAFLARVLGTVDELFFLSPCGPVSPTIALTVAGTTLLLTFPGLLHIDRVNYALRRHRQQLVGDPYGHGWLYEGRTFRRPVGITARHAATPLRRGPEAARWMAAELKRLSAHVRSMALEDDSQRRWAADGGEVAAGLAQHLNRAELLEIFNRFFSSAPR